MRSIFFLLAVFTISICSHSQWSVNPAGGSIRARDSMRVDSLRSSLLIGTDSNGKFVKRDSARAAHISDTAVFALSHPHYERVVFVAKSGGDYSTIQDAVNSISDNSVSKRYCVYVFPGLYEEQVTLKEGIDLIGAGKHCVQMQFTGNNNGTIILANYTQVQDILIEGTLTATEWGIVGTNVHDVHIRDVDILNPFAGTRISQGIKITGASIKTIFIEHCIINCYSYTGNAIYIAGNSAGAQDIDATINDVFVDTWNATSGGCVKILDCDNIQIENSIMRTSGSGYCVKFDRTNGSPTGYLKGVTLHYGSSTLEVGTGTTVNVYHSCITSSSNSGTLNSFASMINSKVSVGVNNPSRTLHVAGTIGINGNTHALIEALSGSNHKVIFRADSTRARGSGIDMFGNSDPNLPGGTTISGNGKTLFRLDSAGLLDSIQKIKLRWLTSRYSDSILTVDSVGVIRMTSAKGIIKKRPNRIAKFKADSTLDTSSVEELGDIVTFHKNIIYADSSAKSFNISIPSSSGKDSGYVAITAGGTGYNPDRSAYAILYGVNSALNNGKLLLGSARGSEAWYESKWHNFTYNDSTKIWFDLTSGISGTAAYYSINAYDKGLGLNCDGSAALRLIGDTTSIYGITKVLNKISINQANDGGGYAEIDSNGYRAYGSSQAWDDVGDIKLSNIRVTGVAGSPTWDATGIGFGMNRFSTGDSAQGDVELFHKFSSGDTLEGHVHYNTGGTDSDTRYLRFNLKTWVFNSLDSTTYFFSDTLEDTLPPNVKYMQHRIKSFGKHSVSSITIGSKIFAVLKKVTATNVAPTSNPFVSTIGYHKRVNDLGSRTIYTK
jgi:hypothetical protein